MRKPGESVARTARQLALALAWLLGSMQRAEGQEQGTGAAKDVARAAKLDQQKTYHERIERAVSQGRPEEVAEAASKFIELERELAGEETPGMAFALRQLAQAALQRKDDAAALAHLQKALAVERKIHGEDHWHVVDVRTQIEYVEAIAKLPEDRRDAVSMAAGATSLEDLRRALVVLRHAAGERTPEYAATLEKLASALRARGNPLAAQVWAERCLAIRKDVLGERHPNYLLTLQFQALLHRDLEENDDELRLLEAADGLRPRVPEMDLRVSASLSYNLGAARSASGDLDGAARAFEESAHLLIQAGGEGDAEYVNVLAEQADLARRRRDFATARGLWDRVLSSLRPNKDRDNGRYALALTRAARTLQDQGDQEGAARLAREARGGPPGVPWVRMAMYGTEIARNLLILSEGERRSRQVEAMRLGAEAEALRRQGKLDDAARVLESQVGFLKDAIDGAESDLMVHSMERLAEVHLGRGDFAAARRAREQCVSSLRWLLRDEHWQAIDADLLLRQVDRIAALAPDRRARLEEVRELRDSAIDSLFAGLFTTAASDLRSASELQSELLGEADPDSLDLLGDLGVALILDGRAGEAEAVASRAVALNRRARGPRHPSVIASLTRLAEAREARGNRRGAQAALLEAAPAKRPTGKPGAMSIVLLYHANGLVSAAVRGSDEILTALPPRIDGSGTARDIIAVRSLADAEQRILGDRHPARYESLIWVARRHQARHQFDGLIAARREAVAFLSRTFGPDDWRTADARAELVAAERMAVVSRDDPNLLRAAEHADNQRTIDSATGEAVAVGDQSRRILAALILWRKVLGERAQRCVTDLENIGVALREQGQLDAAERALGRVVELRRQTTGEGHPSYAQALARIGAVLIEQGRAAEAESVLRRSVALLRQQIGRAHPLTATVLLDRSRALRDLGQYEEARTACEDGGAILRADFGESHPNTLMAVVDLATLLQIQGDYAVASDRLEAIFKARAPAGSLGGDLLTTTCAANLASLLGKRGEFARAKILLERLLGGQRVQSALARSVLDPRLRGQDIGEGTSHPAYAARLQTLADLLIELGDGPRAYRLASQALELTEELLGPDHPAMAERRLVLARALVLRGDRARAEAMLDEAERGLKPRGDRDPLRPSLLATRAAIRAADGRPGEAAGLLERAVATAARAFGEDHPEHVRLLGAWAESLIAQGDDAAARAHLERALTLVRGRRWADPVAEANLLVNLTRIYARSGDLAGARDLCRRALRLREDHIARNLAGLGERERLAIVAKFREPFLDALELLKGDPSLDREAFGHLVVWKGIATAAARQEGRSMRGRERVFLTRQDPWRGPLASITKLLVADAYERFATPRDEVVPPGRQPPVAVEWARHNLERERRRDSPAESLARHIEAIGETEARAASGVVEPLPAAELDRVFAAVPDRAVLLEFIREEPRAGEPRYSVFVVRREGPLRRLDLGPAAAIDLGIRSWLAAIEADSDDWAPASGLHQRVWAPVASLCGDADTVLIAPDGELNHMPWGALPDLSPGAAPGRFLLERYTFALVPSSQRLIDAGEPAPLRQGLLVIGGIDYDRAEPPPDPSGRPALMAPPFADRGTLTPAGPALLKVPPLPGTAEEIRDVQRLFETTHGPSGVTVALSGPRIDKSRVEAGMLGMRYIHMASHGFFDPQEIRDALAFEDGRPALRSATAVSRREAAVLYPGLLSGLMLAGVNNPQPWGVCHLNWGAGLLTAEEVAGVDLSGCELAVLSACETAVGRIAEGEGALGLQRAFHVAGARFVISSLWRIGDLATRRLMSRFYENLWVRGLSPPDAMRSAQLSLLSADEPPDEMRGPGRLVPSDARSGVQPKPRRRQHPRVWAAWVVSGVPQVGPDGARIAVAAAPPPPSRPRPSADTTRPRSVPPGWLGGKIEPFLGIAVAPGAGAAFTTSESGLLRHYSYPDFTEQGSYKLAGPAYRVELDVRRGLLFAVVARPGALRVEKPNGEPSGVADLQVYDIKSILEGRAPAGPDLTPEAVVPLGANVSCLLALGAGPRLYCLERDTTARGPARMVRVDTFANRVDRELDLPAGTEAACPAPDGSTLYASVSTAGHVFGRVGGSEDGMILDIDPETLKVRREVRIPIDPSDIQAGDAGLVFVTGGSNQHTAIAVVKMNESGRLVARWGGVFMGTRVRLSPDRSRLFLAPTTTPPSVETWLLPENMSESPTAKETLTAPTGIPLGGEIFLSPRGDFLLTRPGGVIPLRTGKGPR